MYTSPLYKAKTSITLQQHLFHPIWLCFTDFRIYLLFLGTDEVNVNAHPEFVIFPWLDDNDCGALLQHSPQNVDKLMLMIPWVSRNNVKRCLFLYHSFLFYQILTSFIKKKVYKKRELNELSIQLKGKAKSGWHITCWGWTAESWLTNTNCWICFVKQMYFASNHLKKLCPNWLHSIQQVCSLHGSQALCLVGWHLSPQSIIIQLQFALRNYVMSFTVLLAQH